jgi:hypothetical protein
MLAGLAVAEAVPDFHRDIEPILRRHCVRCHAGPEAEADLRLTSRAEATKEREFVGAAIVPGDAAASPLFHRISDPAAGDLMPLDGQPLAKAEVDRLRRWIDAGAPWPDVADVTHWAYVPPTRPNPPTIADAQNNLGAIDRFVVDRLRQETLAPSPRSEPARLVRRLALVLTGLPPDVETVERFERDPSPTAYAKLVDHYLAQPTFGQHWARHWLDLARYSDSNGYQADQLRETWPYRDWVVDAFNANKPFDEFTVEQLAGDLLLNATLENRIATGFHRMTTCNVEAGVDPEENRVNQVVDRVNTTATVFLGATLSCTQCHDHKYDPFSQREYYQLFAFFNQTPLEVKLDSGVQYDFVGPTMTLPIPSELQTRHTELTTQLASAKTELAEMPAAASASASDEAEEVSTRRKALNTTITKLNDQISKLAPSTLVMVEIEKPRETFVMNRGSYLDPGEAVEPNTPAVLHGWQETYSQDRLGFARWLVDRRNPLLARVTVNRYWAEIFGAGLVTTLEDFGTQGERPSHAELLDWLAVEFMDSGWDTKHVLRLMVISEAFQRDSRVTSESLEQDPTNRLLARGPRYRLSAETIRDNALAISGLLATESGGSPIMPFQPDGIWKAVGRNQPTWQAESDANRFRRGLYVVWKRGAPYPSFVNFDAPDRATCTVGRPRTNTPLQALTLLNDPVYAEAALALAQRTLQERPESDVNDRLEFAFRLCVARAPRERELAILRRVLEAEQQTLTRDPKLAWERLKNLPEFARPTTDEPVELAAWFAVANVLLNLDETITLP